MAVAYSRVMFLGTAGVGKTCFNRSLRKLPWKSDTSSTIISDVRYIQPRKPIIGASSMLNSISITSSKSFTHQWHTRIGEQWKEVTQEEEIEELAYLLGAVYDKIIMNNDFSHSASFMIKNIFTEKREIRVEMRKVEDIVSRAISVARCHTSRPIISNDEFDSQPFLHFWDCGGQPAFLEILPAFLTPRTMFFLIFDASKPLNTYWQSNYHIEGKQFNGEEVNMATLDHMINWMANIHSHLMAYNEDGSVADYPRMFCIGTHGDLLTEEEKSKVKRELESHYHNKRYSHLIEDTLIIDNTTSDTENEDPSLHTIRKEVIKFTVKKLVKITPLTWVLFRKVLKVLGVNVISIHTAYEIGAASNIPQDDVPSVLLFYHDLGAVLFYPHLSGLKDKVIINPKYFIDALGKIFSFDLQNDMPRFSREVELFRYYGILVEPLYAEVWKSCEDLKPHMFVEVLSHFRLAAQVNTHLYPQPHKQYFIPSILPLCRIDASIVLPENSFCTAPLHLTFSTGFVPPGFFTRFVAVLATRMQLLLDRGVNRNHVTFRYKNANSSSIEHMTITDHHDAIQIIAFRATSGSIPLPLQKVYPKLLTIINDSAHEVEKILSHCTFSESNNKAACPVSWSIQHVCTNCPPSTSLHYLILAPGGQTAESEISCQKCIEEYRKLKKEELNWFSNQYESISDDSNEFQNFEDMTTHKTSAIDRFIKVSGQLPSAITSCINGVVNGLHAKGLIGFELKDDLINSHIINARKADKLITEIERLLRSSSNSDEVLKMLSTVLVQQEEKELMNIANSLVFNTGNDECMDKPFHQDIISSQMTVASSKILANSSSSDVCMDIAPQGSYQPFNEDITFDQTTVKSARIVSTTSDDECMDIALQGSFVSQPIHEDMPSRQTTVQPANPKDIFKTKLFELSTVIENDVLRVLMSCYSVDVIDQTVYDATMTGTTNYEKASKLVMGIFNQLQSHQDKYSYFLQIMDAFLKVNNPGLTEIVEQMKCKLL